MRHKPQSPKPDLTLRRTKRSQKPNVVRGCRSSEDRHRLADTNRKWKKEQRSTRSPSYSPQPPKPRVRIQTRSEPDPDQQTLTQDITSCQWLYDGSYIGNETRHIEFKMGSGYYYMRDHFKNDVSRCGCAFLNSEGGSLLIGVSDDGVVHGVYLNHEKEDKARLLMDQIATVFRPPLFPHSYNLRFLPVIKPGGERTHLKVVCITFSVTPTFIEPTLYCVNHDQVYIRRDGGVQGPLGPSDIIEWWRQMCAKQSYSTLLVLATLLQRQQSVSPPRQQATESLNSSSGENSQVSASLPARPPDAGPAHNTSAPDLALESTPLPDHNYCLKY